MDNQHEGDHPQEGPKVSAGVDGVENAAASAAGGSGARGPPREAPELQGEGAGGCSSAREESVEPFLHADNARIVSQALDPSAFADNVEQEIVERLSRSQVRQRGRSN